jgi:hypothetical protein
MVFQGFLAVSVRARWCFTAVVCSGCDPKRALARMFLARDMVQNEITGVHSVVSNYTHLDWKEKERFAGDVLLCFVIARGSMVQIPPPALPLLKSRGSRLVGVVFGFSEARVSLCFLKCEREFSYVLSSNIFQSP